MPASKSKNRAKVRQKEQKADEIQALKTSLDRAQKERDDAKEILRKVSILLRRATRNERTHDSQPVLDLLELSAELIERAKTGGSGMVDEEALALYEPFGDETDSESENDDDE